MPCHLKKKSIVSPQPIITVHITYCGDIKRFTCVALWKTLVLWLDQSNRVAPSPPVQACLHPGGLLVNVRQIFHVPFLGFHLPPQLRVPPRLSVFRQSLQQRGEDAVVRVGEIPQAVQIIAGGSRRREQRPAAGDQHQKGYHARATEGSWHQHLFLRSF